jgi:hypothetical protein
MSSHVEQRARAVAPLLCCLYFIAAPHIAHPSQTTLLTKKKDCTRVFMHKRIAETVAMGACVAFPSRMYAQ